MSDGLRWRVEEHRPQGQLFAPVDREVGTGEYRGMEFLHVRAQRIINELKQPTPLPFRFTINAYRGCSHACTYCAAGETPVLLADGRTRPLADLRLGDEIVGTEGVGDHRRYVRTTVLDHWSVMRPAWRVRLDDGTDLVTSGDHRFLSDRGWKHVFGTEQGAHRRPHLTMNNRLLGPGPFVERPKEDEDYRHGYLSGMVRGDGHLRSYQYERAGRTHGNVHHFRVALADDEPLARSADYLAVAGVPTKTFSFAPGTERRRALEAIRTQSAGSVDAIRELIAWPVCPSESWWKGFLAGIFDAEGGCSQGIWRVANTDRELIDRTTQGLDHFGFRWVVEQAKHRTLQYVRLLGGLPEQLRFSLLTDPATTRKRSIIGRAVKNSPLRRVVAVEAFGLDLPLYDITTGTGDYIAEGLISHNCFARPTHEYLGLGIGEDFDRRIVVKVNAVERLRAELHPARWPGHPIAMGTNTDPYQRCEGKYHLTRGIVEVLAEVANPFSILTKSTLVKRDLELLADAARRTDVRVNLSVGTLDEEVWRTTEPGTPHPRQRLRVVRDLNRAGVPCGVLVAPVIPGLSDRPEQLEAVAAACVESGAVSVSTAVLHLRPGVKEHFFGQLARTHPELLEEHRARYGERAYLPKAQQRRVSDDVAGAVRRAGGCPPPPAPVHVRPTSPPAAPRAAPSQLHLSL